MEVQVTNGTWVHVRGAIGRNGQRCHMGCRRYVDGQHNLGRVSEMHRRCYADYVYDIG